MHDKEAKQKVLQEIADLAKTLMAEKIKGKRKPKEMAVEVEVISSAPKKKRSKEELMTLLGL